MLKFSIPLGFDSWPVPAQLREYADQLDSSRGGRRMAAVLIEAACEIELAEWAAKHGDALPGPEDAPQA